MDKIEKTNAEWKALLTPEQYRVTRRRGTEPPFMHPYNAEKAAGTYCCVCCGAALFSSQDKFDSGTGWPSYFRSVAADAVTEHTDRWLFLVKRVEVRCARCDAHLGHVFPDGPKPTRLRYCINGVALNLEAERE
ncbi:MAG: peptide-methionine (R)-S-oxide reductase MsrB [Propylenella sp.]